MTHKDISLLLPWYANGTLGADERRAVELELATCRSCAAELEELQSVRAGVADVHESVPDPSPFLLSRALSRIEEDDREKESERRFLRGWWRRQVPVMASIVLAVPLVFAAAFAAVLVARYLPSAQSTMMANNEATPISLDAARVTPMLAAPRSAVAPSASKTVANEAAAPAATPRAAPQVIRTGSVSLIVPEVEAAIHSLYAIAQRENGAVSSLQDETPNAPGAHHTASLSVRVPESRFDATMQAVAGVGKVSSRTVTAQDVSGQIVDLQARLRNLRHTETDLLRIMDRSGAIDQVLEVENQISSVREQIEQLDGQLKATQNQVAYSEVDVALSDEIASPVVRSTFAARVAEAWRSAKQSALDFAVALASLVVWLVAFLPYIVVIGLIALLVWAAKRRRAPIA